MSESGNGGIAPNKWDLGEREEDQDLNNDSPLNNNGERRNSVSKMFQRLRSGSLPGWIAIGMSTSSTGSSTGPTADNSDPSSSILNRIKRPHLPIFLRRGSKEDTEMSTLPQYKNNSSSSSSSKSTEPGDSSCTTTEACSGGSGSRSRSTSMTRYAGDEEENVHISPSGLPLDDDEDLVKNEEEEDTLFPSSPLSLLEDDSSPLTGRQEFTIVPCSTQDPVKGAKRKGNQNLGLIISALYGKLLVVLGIAFPMAEVISTYIPHSYYDGFYLYLYFGSITFMICVYGNVLRQKATRSVRCTLQRISTMTSTGIHTMTSRLTTHHGPPPPPDVSNTGLNPENLSSDSEECGCGSVIDHTRFPEEVISDCSKARMNFGSFYLRMGAVAFGIGSMIYSGLEFGQYFELSPDTKCHNLMIALTPAVRMMFTFMQMYFIFLNSKMAVHRLEFSNFGLMHMIGTNLCVWLNVLVQETRHEILLFYNPDNGSLIYPSTNLFETHTTISDKGSLPHPPIMTTPVPTTTTTTTLSTTMATTLAGLGIGSLTTPTPLLTTTTPTAPGLSNFTSQLASTVASALAEFETLPHNVTTSNRVRRGLRGPYSFLECRRSDIMGSLVQNASPFLFPCTIEYSLICAAILYVMWKSMAKMNNSELHHGHFDNDHFTHAGSKRSPHHYSVDCARANKGLFLGIFVLVMTIISLILFFVLINRPGYQALAVVEVNVTELVLYSVTTTAVLIGMCQLRELRYVRSRNLELDSILLVVSQTGSFIYNVFTIIGGHFTIKRNTSLVLVTALASLIQVLFQTLFILDASKRSASTAEQARRKPGREVVTFLLVTNLAMWAINTLEKSRADSHPVQLKFYGVWAWTIITHISMPLAIFYRFHSTVCLVDIWKRAYKVKTPSPFRC